MQNKLKLYNKFHYDSKPNPNSVIMGSKYRITVLFDKMFRLEYQDEGIFEDRPTQIFWFRNQLKPNFTIDETNTHLVIKTDFWKITYEKEQPFSKDTLKIESLVDDKTWHFNKSLNNNLLGTARTLDQADGEIPLEDGLFSRDGYTIIDEKDKLVYDNYSLIEREHKGIDLYFLGYFDNFKKGLNHFYKVSGKTPLIPKFALGNWWSRYWNYTDMELKETISNFEKLQIPLSVCIIDMDWHLVKIDPKYGDGWTGYTWNNENFPNPEETIKWLHDKDLSVSLNLHPATGFMPHEKYYKEIANYLGYNPNDKKQIPFNCNDNEFMKAYFHYGHYPIEKQGVDFWWIDWQQGSDSGLKGLDPLWALNHLHYLDSMKNGNRGFIFSRYPGLGGHRYPIGFSGDTLTTWESLEFQPYFTKTASNIGYGWWSHDIGGHFDGINSKELYIRWVQQGVFSPIFRLHSGKNHLYVREPWRWDLETQHIVKEYMNLRHELIPYIYSMASINSKGDYPLIRPLYYHDNNEKSYNDKTTYFFGSELIISPFVTPLIDKLNQSKKDMYLPNGDWFDYNDGSYYKGNNTYTLYGDLRETPIFAKAGAIIPKSETRKNNDISNPKNLILDIFPNANNKFTLYEDDGISIPNDDNFHETKFILNSQKNKMKLKINHSGTKDVLPESRKLTLRFRSINEDVQVDLKHSHKISYNNDSKTLIVEIDNYGYKDLEVQVSSSNEITYKFYDSLDKVSNIIISSTYLNTDKQQIGYIYKKYNQEGMGILNKDIKVNNKIELIDKLDVPNELKLCAINILKNHL